MFSLLSLSWWIWGCKLVLTVPIHQDFEAKWIPPSAPFFKVNVDGLFSLHRRKQAWEFLAIDSWAKALFFFFFGVRGFGFQFARDVGIQEFVIEGDSFIISQALGEQTSSPSSLAPIIYGMMSSIHGLCWVEFLQES